MDGGEEAGAQIVVQVLVLTHLEHFLPLFLSHLALDALSSLFLLTQLLTTKLQQQEENTDQTFLIWTSGTMFYGDTCFHCLHVCTSYSWVSRGHIAGQEGQLV